MVLCIIVQDACSTGADDGVEDEKRKRDINNLTHYYHHYVYNT